MRRAETSEPLGMLRERPRLVEYDDRWPQIFLDLRDRLYEALQDRILSVHHVGSTAVPGLLAKPILDVLIGIADFDAALECVPPLADLGFEYRPHDAIPDRHFFRAETDGLRTHHLSLAETASLHYTNALVFRDALRESPELAREYEALKMKLLKDELRSGNFPPDGKSEFVMRVVASHGGLTGDKTA